MAGNPEAKERVAGQAGCLREFKQEVSVFAGLQNLIVNLAADVRSGRQAGSC